MREEFERSVSADLAHCAVFVQLLGFAAGKRPPDVPDGFGWVQLELAKRAKLPILQWRSPDLDVSKIDLPLQKRLLELETVRAMPFEDFKRIVIESCYSVTERASQLPFYQQPIVSPSMLFINADPVDRESVDRIRETIGDRIGWTMPLSFCDGKAPPEELQQDTESNLINSDGLVIVYGAVRPAWVTKQLQLYRKVAPRRAKSPRLLAVVEAPPEPKTPISIGLPGLLTIGMDRIGEVVNSALLQ